MPRTNRRLIVVAWLVLGTMTLGLAFLAGQAWARPAQVQPIKAPESLLRARVACPNDATPVQCRSALRRAYESAAWQRKARLAAKATTIREITLDAIAWAAAKYHVSPVEMRTVGTCESHLWPFATNG